MVRDDLETENAGKHDDVLGNNVEELINTFGDAKNEIKGERLPCTVTDVGDANRCENGAPNFNGLEIDAKDDIAAKNEVEYQTNLQRETSEPVFVEGSMDEQMYTITKNEEQMANEQTDVKNEVVEQKACNVWVEVVKSAENVVEDGNPVKDVLGENTANGVEGEDPLKSVIEENPSGDGSAEKYNESDTKTTQFSTDEPSNEAPPLDKVVPGGDEKIEEAANISVENIVNDEPKEQGKEILLASPVTDENVKTIETAIKHEVDHSSLPSHHEAATPSSLIRYSPAKAGDHSGFTPAAQPLMAEGDDGTPEAQASFMKEIGNFYREKAMDFKPPKFYGQPLNCLKLWRAVIRLGGYDRVTGSKLWRQVGESFHPPKTCTTVSWTFRIFYEKSLLEYERHKTLSGELQLPEEAILEASGVDAEGNSNQGPGLGRAKRDSAARAMQGWHVQRLFGNGEVSDPVVKDKSISNMAKREKNVKTIGSLKQKRPNEVESSVKAARIETSKQLATTVVDVGPPTDWVKINVRQTKDCFEVYALVPGLLREEVRVQSDPAGRLVITGQPEQVDNPWGITPFKKVISLPSRIDPLQTSAVVSLHGRLFVRVPFEQSNG